MQELDRNCTILGHIKSYCDEIEKTVIRFGDDRQIFLDDSIYRNACALSILQIGELANHLGKEFRSDNIEIPWNQVIGIRNIIAHGYGTIVPETEWEIIKDDIPNLRTFCEKKLG